MTSNKPSFIAVNWNEVNIYVSLRANHPTPTPPSRCVFDDTLSHSVTISVCTLCLRLIWFCSSMDAKQTSYFNCDCDSEDSNPVGLHETPAYGDVSSFQVCLQKVQPFRRYRSDEHSLTFSTFAVTLNLNTAIKSFPKTARLMMMDHLGKFSSTTI